MYICVSRAFSDFEVNLKCLQALASVEVSVLRGGGGSVRMETYTALTGG